MLFYKICFVIICYNLTVFSGFKRPARFNSGASDDAAAIKNIAADKKYFRRLI
jgi:hypothetical protein